MRILSTTIPDLFVAESDAFRDDRGAFFRCFCADELQTVIGDRQIKQVNHSRTENVGAVRGMHFQFARLRRNEVSKVLAWTRMGCSD